MNKQQESTSIYWEQATNPHAEARLQAAFEMLFASVPIELPQRHRNLTESPKSK
jgi:hypothetical protein